MFRYDAVTRAGELTSRDFQLYTVFLEMTSRNIYQSSHTTNARPNYDDGAVLCFVVQ